LRIWIEATAILAGSILIALFFNQMRSLGLPLIAEKEYQIFIPCPEQKGDAHPLAPTDPRLTEKTTLLIDCRSGQQYTQWHLPAAISVEYDFLTPIAEDYINSIIASKVNMVVIYGDGDDPDSGQEMARELAGRGIKNVYFIKGGAPALGN